MNTKNRFCLLLLSSLSAAGLTHAQPQPPPPSPDHEPNQKFERRVFVRRGDHPLEKENVTFLGVETSPISATLTAQLGLPKDAGLVVSHIVPESPAAATLKPHDILLKMDDQLLIDSRQFSVLVRSHQEGDTVTLTYVRSGKQATATVKLAKHEVPKFAGFESRAFEPGGELPPGLHGPLPHSSREEMDRVLSLIDRGGAGPTVYHRSGPGGSPGLRATAVNPGNSNIVYKDDQGSLTLTIKDGQKNLVANNPKGEQVFSGPVTTPEQRQALPAELRARLDQIEGMYDFSFETDDTFHDHLKMLPIEREKILLAHPRREQRPIPSQVL